MWPRFAISASLGCWKTCLARPAYIAPEFIHGGKPSSSTDQYSLAVTYVERNGPALPGTLGSGRFVHLNGELDFPAFRPGETGISPQLPGIWKTASLHCVAFVKLPEEACGRIPPEEMSLMEEGVARRLNASGLIAGMTSSADSHSTGPFSPRPRSTRKRGRVGPVG